MNTNSPHLNSKRAIEIQYNHTAVTKINDLVSLEQMIYIAMYSLYIDNVKGTVSAIKKPSRLSIFVRVLKVNSEPIVVVDQVR